MSDYPEHDKLAALDGKNQVVGDFITWLRSNYEIAKWIDDEDEGELLIPVSKSIQSILAEYYGIDEAKLEAEKRAMIAAIRGE